MCAPTGMGPLTRADGGQVGITVDANGNPLKGAAPAGPVAATPVDPAIIAARQNLIMNAQKGASSSATGGSAPTGT